MTEDSLFLHNVYLYASLLRSFHFVVSIVDVSVNSEL